MGGMEKNHFARKVIPRKKKENLLISIYTRAADCRILGWVGEKDQAANSPRDRCHNFSFYGLWF